jgi:hypothetical protein
LDGRFWSIKIIAAISERPVIEEILAPLGLHAQSPEIDTPAQQQRCCRRYFPVSFMKGLQSPPA